MKGRKTERREHACGADKDSGSWGAGGGWSPEKRCGAAEKRKTAGPPTVKHLLISLKAHKDLSCLIFFFNLFYLFIIFGCVGSSLLRAGFL